MSNRDSSSVAAAAPAPAQAVSGPASTRPPQESGGRHTLHIEYAVWSDSYRIIHTRPDGKRQVWRRGIESLDEAKLRMRVVSDVCGYHIREAHQ